jgi:hypothetical protein
MQYLVSVIDDTTGLATLDEMAAINAFNDRLEAEGHWVFAGGLASPSSATVIDNRDGEALFTDGPFLSLRSTSLASGLWRLPTSTWRSSSQPKGRRPAIERLRCGRFCDSGRRPGGDHRGPARGAGGVVADPHGRGLRRRCPEISAQQPGRRCGDRDSPGRPAERAHITARPECRGPVDCPTEPQLIAVEPGLTRKRLLIRR